MSTALSPKAILIDILGGGDFDHQILDAEAAASIIIDRLAQNGYIIIDMRLAIWVP
jgi:hypothetical protein